MSRLPALPGFCLALLPACSHAALPGWIPTEWLAPTPYPALLLLGLSAVGLLLWVWRLRRRRRQRFFDTLEQSLRGAAQHDHGLMAQLPLVSWEMRLSDLRFTHVSPQAAALLGYPVEAWLEADFCSRTLYPADAAATLAFLQGDGDAQTQLEHRLIAADGRPVWVLAIVQRLPSGDDSLLQGLFIDIGRSKQVEQVLRLSEQKFSSAFHNSPDIMLLLERDSGRILTANRAFEQASGLSADAVCGRTTSELGLWCRHEQGLQVLQQLQAHDLQNIEVSLLRHGKEAFTGLLSARRIELDGQPAAIVVLRDLADLQSALQQLHSSEEKFAKVFHASPDALSITRQAAQKRHLRRRNMPGPTGARRIRVAAPTGQRLPPAGDHPVGRRRPLAGERVDHGPLMIAHQIDGRHALQRIAGGQPGHHRRTVRPAIDIVAEMQQQRRRHRPGGQIGGDRRVQRP